MTEDEWEKRRDRAIMAAFQTGRPVFADSEGTLRYTDGAKEEVPLDVGTDVSVAVDHGTGALPRAARWSRRAYVFSLVAAVANGISVVWHPWQIAAVAVCLGSAILWRRVHRGQRTLLGAGR